MMMIEFWIDAMTMMDEDEDCDKMMITVDELCGFGGLQAGHRHGL